MSISAKESEALEGLNESYIEMEANSPPPPKCHFRHMKAEGGDFGEWWWECSYCGHTKHGSDGYQGER